MDHEKDIPDIDDGGDDDSDRENDGLNDPGGGPGGAGGLRVRPSASPTGPGAAGALAYPLSPASPGMVGHAGPLGETRLDLGAFEGADAPPFEPPRKSNMFLDKPRLPEKNVKRHSIHGMMDEENVVRPHQEMKQLSLDEKKFLLAVERGDVASTRRMLQRAQETCHMNVNCVDPLGRSALLMAIDNENLEMVELLLEYRVETKDALLHAISEQFVEAVEVLLDQEEAVHRHGELHSWEALPSDTATFTPDITPLILAAHRDNYEIIKILLDRGSTLPMPHDVRCGCDECVTSRQEDSLRHSRSRINAYRALASPSLIALSSKDPILTAFELSWELRRLSFLEHEFKTEYQELRKQCQDFATALLDHTRSSYELEVLLNHDPTGPAFEHGERMHLNRLKLAIKLRQKKFVAHPNVQQLLASIWYEGLPGFRRKNMVLQALEIVRIGAMFPFFSAVYVVAPHSGVGQTLRKPFIKFLCHAASYFTFLFLLILASQRIESVIAEWIFGADFSSNDDIHDVTTKRGAPPSVVECLILAWVLGLIWSEVKQLWDVGLEEYANDMWNVIDFVTNSLYVATVALRVVAYYQVQKEKETFKDLPDLPREQWDTWDPMLISEGLFSAANIFSSLKLVYIFSVNPYLGPLQVSLSRMVMDIMKFFFLYVLVLFAFSCGLNQLLWYYADMEKQICNKNQPAQSAGQGNATHPPDRDACVVWRRFANLFETTQTLFWAVFGLVDLDNFELAGIKSFTRFWGMLMFGTYSVINIVVLLNLLIATMNHSYQLISERADTEWKFARSKLWISYFEEGGTVPPPFNVIPTPKSIFYICRWLQRKLCGHSRAAKKEHMRTIRRKVKQASERDFRYQSIMRNLVRRYVTVEQRKAESQGVTEDDVNEIKQDISAFRCELIEILKNSGMNTLTSSSTGAGSGGKKNRQKERRLMKGFNIAPPPSSAGGQNLSPVVEMPLTSDVSEETICASADNGGGAGGAGAAAGAGSVGALGALAGPELFGSTISGVLGVGGRAGQQGGLEGHHGLSRLAPRLHLKSRAGGGPLGGAGPGPHKRRWGTLIEAARAGRVGRLISRSRSEDSVCNGSRQRGHGAHRSNSEEATDTDSTEGLGHPLGHPLASALAALKRKRHKFSTSRGSHAVQTSSNNDSDDVALHGLGGSLQGPSSSSQASASASSAASKKALQRASSVPARTPEEVLEPRPRPRPQRHQQQQEQQQLQQAEARVIEHLQHLQQHHRAVAEEVTSRDRDTLLLPEATGGVVTIVPPAAGTPHGHGLAGASGLGLGLQGPSQDAAAAAAAAGTGQAPSPGEPPSPSGERWYKNRNGLVSTLPNLPPGIQPVSGHNVSAGWL